MLSHKAYDVSRFKVELEAAFETFNNLKKIQFETILPSDTKIHFEVQIGIRIVRVEIVIYEQLKLFKEEGSDSHLAKVFMNYQLFFNGTARGDLSANQATIKHLYDSWYERSDKVKNADFWEEVIISSTGAKLSTLRIF